MNRAQDRRRAASRRLLLENARAVVLRDGLDSFTLEAVARECGFTKQGLLYHFPSKDVLVFELVLSEWDDAARAVADAVARVDDGAAALEAIIRTTVSQFAPRLELFRLVTQEVQRYDRRLLSPEQMARIRPSNELLYGGAERLLRSERRGPRARRLAVSAHLAAFGLLAMKALVERFGDPLRHSDADLTEEICRAFRAAVQEER
jgi:AcrR family transcriptional regulator